MKRENVVEYIRKSNESHMKKEYDVTVYAYEGKVERVRKKKIGGKDHWIV